MPLSDLNLRILFTIKELEDVDDEILFGSNRKTLPELEQEEAELVEQLEALYLLQLDVIQTGYPHLSLITKAVRPQNI